MSAPFIASEWLETVNMWSDAYCLADSDQCGGLTVESIIKDS